MQWNITQPLKRMKWCHSQQHGWNRRYCTDWSKCNGGNILYGIAHMWSLKINYANELTKQKKTHRLREQTYGCLGEGWGKGIIKEFGMKMHTLLYFKWITNKDLWFSAGNTAQCYVAAWMRGEFGGQWIHIHVSLSTFSCSSETITTLMVNQLYPKKK